MEEHVDSLKALMKDGGWMSRKFLLVVGTQLFIFGGSFFVSNTNYGSMVGGLIGALTVYLSGQAYSGSKMADNVTSLIKTTAKPVDQSKIPND
jgi:hypothetical protein